MLKAQGRYFEDFKEGEEFRTFGRTISEADIMNFCGFSGDFNPLDFDAEYAAAHHFGGRIAHGTCSFSIALGLLTQLKLFEGTILAFASIENWRFTAPVMIGDTIHVIARVLRARSTRKPDRGLITFHMDVVNQKDVLVMEGEIVTMMMKRNK